MSTIGKALSLLDTVSRLEEEAGLTDIAHQLYVEPTRRAEFADLMRLHDSVTDFVSQIRRHDGSVIWISENARAVRDYLRTIQR